MSYTGQDRLSIPALFLFHTEGSDLEARLQENPDLHVYMGLQAPETGVCVCVYV